MPFLIFLSIFLLNTQSVVFSHKGKAPLQFNAEGKFKIVNFADLHYGEFPGTDLKGKIQDKKSTKVMEDILSFEKPDFVVFTGDMITADLILINSARYFDKALSVVVAGGYKWASTYGNHENGITTKREKIFAAESKYTDLSYTQHGDANLAGITNYYLPVYKPNSDETSTPILILWFFDSRGGFDRNGIKPSNVDATVVNWFTETNSKIKSKWGIIPALAFFHIPTQEYSEVQADMQNRPDCVGLVDEPVSPQDRDTLFMRALINSGTILTTFVGHNHGNAWCCAYETLQLCFNRHSGYGGYGDWTRGARVVELDMSQNMWTSRRNYIRLENGTIIDEYPARAYQVTAPN